MNVRLSRGLKLGLAPAEAHVLARLKTPEDVQDFVTALPTNFEPEGDTCWSVVESLRRGRAHCIEGAFVAACALWLQGRPPLLMDFVADGDDDHVIALFRQGGCWGAISKSNHIWLRWRDPIYRSLRELALSYFHEYVLGEKKTLRRYSRPLDLRRLDPGLWVTNGTDCWEVAAALDSIRHFPLMTPAQARRLRPRDAVELQAGKMLQYPAPDAKTARRY
jgi:hypothetical protein